MVTAGRKLGLAFFGPRLFFTPDPAGRWRFAIFGAALWEVGQLIDKIQEVEDLAACPTTHSKYRFKSSRLKVLPAAFSPAERWMIRLAGSKIID